MSVILLLILASLAVALAFLAAFIWAVRSGQFEDTCTPAMRILAGEDSNPNSETRDLKETPQRQSASTNPRIHLSTLHHSTIPSPKP